MTTYRIMVRGEDGTEFCYADRLKDDEELPKQFDNAVDDYPCAMIFLEREETH